MSLKNSNYICFFILFLILLFKIINNTPPPDIGPPKDHDPFNLDDEFFPPPFEEDFLDNHKGKRNETKRNIDIKIKINNKKKTLKELREKTQEIIKKNYDSKNLLEKYNFYYFIISIVNIIFILIIISLILCKFYIYSKQNILNSNNLIISILNKNNQIIQNNIENNYLNKTVISETSFVIPGINDKPEVESESFDKSGNVAPTVNNHYENNKV